MEKIAHRSVGENYAPATRKTSMHTRTSLCEISSRCNK